MSEKNLLGFPAGGGGMNNLKYTRELFLSKACLQVKPVNQSLGCWGIIKVRLNVEKKGNPNFKKL